MISKVIYFQGGYTERAKHAGRHKSCRRHHVGVPKGLLFHIVLRALDRHPMSGSEIVEEIEEVSGWKPSPGSIYPLLRKLKREGLIERVESEVAGLKPFTLTTNGEAELARLKKQKMLFKDKYYAIRRTYWKLIRGTERELYDVISRLLTSIEDAEADLRERKESFEELKSILNKSIQEIKDFEK